MGAAAWSVGLGSCASDSTRWDAVRVQGEELAVEFRPSIDRFTYIGPVDKAGPNLLFVQKQHDAPAPDESYTFFGGCYTWIAPQNAVGGRLGWRDAQGAARGWPPDPAMDIGPTRVERISNHELRMESPVNRMGLREIKEFRIDGAATGSLDFRIQNTTDGIVTAGPWVNTAVAPGSVIAVRMTPQTPVWGWNDESVSRFRSLAAPVERSGWTIIEPDKADWDGGIKVYLDTPAEIAIWRDGYWLHRRQLNADDGRLRALGEGPVAVYIQPARGADVAIVEAELYGAIADIAPLADHTGTERWTLIPSATPDVWALPRAR